MTRFLCLLALLPVSAAAAEGPDLRVTLSRTLMIFRCDDGGKCAEVARQDGPANFTVRLERRARYAPHGEEKVRVEAGGAPFKAEIILNEIPKGLSLYLVLRSGPTTKRHGVTKKAVVNPADFAPLVLEDKTYQVGGNNYRARLVVGPAR